MPSPSVWTLRIQVQIRIIFADHAQAVAHGYMGKSVGEQKLCDGNTGGTCAVYDNPAVFLAILFAMANPVPEIMPDIAKAAGAKVIGTGRSDFPNQINNVVQ